MATEIICDGFRGGGKLITCGNGGSAADAMHIVGELMKGFLLPRKIENFNPEFVKRAQELSRRTSNISKQIFKARCPP